MRLFKYILMYVHAYSMPFRIGRQYQTHICSHVHALHLASYKAL